MDLLLFHDLSISLDDIYVACCTHAFPGALPQVAVKRRSKKPRVVRGLRLPQGLLSRFEVFVLAGQNVLHHKPPMIFLGKQFKHLVSGSSF
jgi:hypothetical protein